MDKDTNKMIAFVIAVLVIAGTTIFITASMESKDNYEEWQEWSGHDDITYSLYLTLKSSNNLPPKK